VSNLLAGLVAALVVTSHFAFVSNLVAQTAQTTGTTVKVPDPNDPVAKEYKKLMELDDAAQEEVDKWIKENEEFAKKGAGVPKEDLNRRIKDRLDVVHKAYKEFIKRHPKHVDVRLAYASFLDDLHDEEGEYEQLSKALELETNNPAVYNNLANYYGHNSPVKKAFEYYQKAIDLNPNEPVYYHNFGTTVYLFRKDAMEFYNITEQEVFNKALELYARAMKLAPDDFPLASDVAQTYYGIKPTRTEDALKAWTNALNIAHDEVERQGVYLHLARIKLHAERFGEARAHINAVTNAMYDELKGRLLKNLNAQEADAKAKAKERVPDKPVEK
jgi:tetratricopeptide (TPR) repeat protein